MSEKKKLNLNSDVFASSVLDLTGCSTIMHILKVADDTAVRSSPYRLHYNLKEELDRQINLLVETKTLVPSNSQYACPVILVNKADMSYRSACGFSRLKS